MTMPSVQPPLTAGGRDLESDGTADQPSLDQRSRWSLLFGIVMLVGTTLGLGLMNGVADGHLVDTDAYSWLNRAIDLRYEGQWFDDTLERVNPPVGLHQHWSRPFDVLLIAGSLVGEPFVDFSTALFSWAVVVPVLLGVATLWLLWWGFSDLIDDAGRDALALLLGLQFTIVMGFMAGRSDHQALMAPLLVAVAAFSRRGFVQSGGTRAVAIAGILSGGALWVGMEAALLICGIAMAATIQWVFRNDDTIGLLSTYGLALAGTACVALFAEHGTHLMEQRQIDELSMPFVGAALALTAAAAVLHGLRAGLTSPIHRAVGLSVAGLMSAAALVIAFPSLLDGPLATVEPLYEQARLRNINEIQSAIGPTFRTTVNVLVPGMSLVPLVVVALVGPKVRVHLITRELCVLLVPACIYLVLAIVQQRWFFMLNLLLVVPAALGAQRLMHLAKPAAQRVNLGMISIASAAALWWFPFFAWSAQEPPAECDIDDAITALERERNPSKVMAFTDHGPELLFHTEHSVLSIPNHRNQPGFTTTYNAMSTTEPATARRVLARSGVDLVLVCDNGVESAFYGGDPESFHAQLSNGQHPDWMRAVATPTGDPRFRLYRVTKR